MAIALDEKLPMSALERNRYFAAARGRRDQRQRRISGEGNSPANRQSVRCGQPHAHAGKAARPAINENATRAASAQHFLDHRDEPLGVAATDHLVPLAHQPFARSEEHTSELQSLMRTSYAVFCLKK